LEDEVLMDVLIGITGCLKKKTFFSMPESTFSHGISIISQPHFGGRVEKYFCSYGEYKRKESAA